VLATATGTATATPTGTRTASRTATERSARGIVARVNGSNVTLQDGRQIFLKGGTVISPRGQQLQAGERIFVQGNPGGNGAINATSVRIGDRRAYGGRS